MIWPISSLQGIGLPIRSAECRMSSEVVGDNTARTCFFRDAKWRWRVLELTHDDCRRMGPVTGWRKYLARDPGTPVPIANLIWVVLISAIMIEFGAWNSLH